MQACDLWKLVKDIPQVRQTWELSDWWLLLQLIDGDRESGPADLACGGPCVCVCVTVCPWLVKAVVLGNSLEPFRALTRLPCLDENEFEEQTLTDTRMHLN